MRLDARSLRSVAIDVFLDGVLVKHCVAFDSEDGWVERYVTDSDGRIIGDRASGPKTERLHGVVTYTDGR